MKIILATKNDSKIKEIKKILDAGIKFVTYKDVLNWPEVEETGSTFLENALLKAKALAQKYDMCAISDDSGLVVDALSGEPGVHSSRYFGVDATDDENIDKLLDNLADKKDRNAAFITVVVFYDPRGKQLVCEGRVDGKIITERRGVFGFGYDPVFVPRGFDITFAQMSAEEKNDLSHRGKAFRNLKQVLKDNHLL